MSAIVSGSPESLEFLSTPRLARRWDRRSVRIAVLIGVVALLNGLDLIYTVFADNLASTTHNADTFREMNPLAAVFLQLGLVPSLICFKILMVFCGLGLLWKVRESRWAVPACWLLFFAYVGLAVMWIIWVSDVNATMEMRLATQTP